MPIALSIDRRDENRERKARTGVGKMNILLLARDDRAIYVIFAKEPDFRIRIRKTMFETKGSSTALDIGGVGHGFGNYKKMDFMKDSKPMKPFFGSTIGYPSNVPK